MAETAQIRVTCSYRGTPRTFAISGSADGARVIDVTIPPTTTDKLVEMAFTFADIKLAFFQADGTLTLETNSGGAPVDTITITGASGRAYVTDGINVQGTNPFTADVTALYVTNAGANAVQLWGIVINDVTP